MIAQIAIAALIYALPTAPPDLPADPAMRCAVKALAGHYGSLSEWQTKGYAAIVADGRPRALVLTAYYGTEPSGRYDGHDQRCSMRTAASNRLAQYTWLWTPQAGLRQVLDTGSAANDHNAERLGGTWVDTWWPTQGQARVDGWVVVRGTVAVRGER